MRRIIFIFPSRYISMWKYNIFAYLHKSIHFVGGIMLKQIATSLLMFVVIDFSSIAVLEAKKQ